MGGPSERAPDEVDARRDVAPLVRAAHLQLDVVVLAEVPEVVGLQQHVAELGVGDPVLALHAVRTESLATIWFTVMCLPTSRRKSSTPIGAVQSALSTRVACSGPGSKSSRRSSCALMPAMLWSSVSRSSRLRSSLRPPGSPTMPVAPPASGNGPVAGQLQPAQRELPEQVPDVEAVGGRVEADVDADRSRGQPGGEGLPVGRVLHEAAGLQLGEEVHSGIMVPRRPRTGRATCHRRAGPATVGWRVATSAVERPGRPAVAGVERVERRPWRASTPWRRRWSFQRRSSEAMGSALYACLLAGLRPTTRRRHSPTQLLEGRSEPADPRGRPAPPARRRAPPGPRGAGAGAGAVLPVGRRDRTGRSDARLPRRARAAPAGGGGRDDPRRADQRGRAGRGAGARLRAHRPARRIDRCGCWRSGSSAGLLLRWDRYRYVAGGTELGDPSSPLCSTTCGSTRRRTCRAGRPSPSAAAATWPRSTPSARTGG